MLWGANYYLQKNAIQFQFDLYLMLYFQYRAPIGNIAKFIQSSNWIVHVFYVRTGNMLKNREENPQSTIPQVVPDPS